jgi:hypothetical protein
MKRYLIEIRMSTADAENEGKSHDIRIQELNTIMNRCGGRYVGYTVTGMGSGTYWYVSDLNMDAVKKIKERPVQGKVYALEEV